MNSRPSPNLPAKLGRYQIKRELGRGAMGRVFLAHDPQIDRQVAIKTVQDFAALPESRRADATERFLREVRAAGRLSHPSIVTVFDVGQDGDLLYLAMEYVEGVGLDAFAQPGALLPVGTVVELIAGIAEALDYAHRAGIVHRDIKPANLMRVDQTSIKIMDFGLARPPEAQLTQDGSLLGTPSYMSPEQIRGGTVDGRSDLFSLGVVLFELLTGDRPFPGDSISSIIYRIVNEEPRDPSVVADRVPGPLSDFLTRALAKEPTDRFATGQEFARELRAAAGFQVSRPTSPRRKSDDPSAPTEARIEPSSIPAERERPPRSSAKPFFFVLVFLLACAAGAGWFFRAELGLDRLMQPTEVWWETRVRTEPPGIPIELDGVALPEDSEGLIRFRPEGPFGVLSAREGCRVAEHRIDPADAGTDVVLVLDPTELTWTIDPGIEGAEVSVNGEALGSAPLEVAFDLCRENRVEVNAAGFRPIALNLPAGTTPLESRTLLNGLAMAEIPRGELVLPNGSVDLVFYVDGERQPKGAERLELTEGEHEIRAKNEYFWIDVRRKVSIAAGESVTPNLNLPQLATLTVQAFPPNCKVHLRKPGGKWRYIDETPLKRKLATGRYEVRITLNPTGEEQEHSVELVPGTNPPLRVKFGGRA